MMSTKTNPTTTSTDQMLHVIVQPSFFSNLKNLESIPNEYINLFDMSDDSDEDLMVSHDELIKKNKRRRRRLLRTVKTMASKAKSTKKSDRASQRTFELSKHDISDQKKISESTFGGGSGSLHTLTEDLRAESIARRGWSDLLFLNWKMVAKSRC